MANKTIVIMLLIIGLGTAQPYFESSSNIQGQGYGETYQNNPYQNTYYNFQGYPYYSNYYWNNYNSYYWWWNW